MSVICLETSYSSGRKCIKILNFFLIWKMISQMQERNDITSKNNSDFSIDHILNHAGTRLITNKCVSPENQRSVEQSTAYPWLHCTRFCPPKIPSKLQLFLRKTLCCISNHCEIFATAFMNVYFWNKITKFKWHVNKMGNNCWYNFMKYLISIS